VHCFDPAGKLIGKILVPQTVANLTFGGPRRNRLFIAANRSLYSLYVAVSGSQVP
jgi:gluconolactonase